MKPGAYEDSATFKADPLKDVADLIDAMKAKGITAESDQRDYFAQIFGNRNAAQMALILGYQYARLERGAHGIENTHDIGQTVRRSPQGQPLYAMGQIHRGGDERWRCARRPTMSGATAALNNLTATASGLAALFNGGAQQRRRTWKKLFFGNQGSPVEGQAQVSPKVFDWAYGNWANDPSSAGRTWLRLKGWHRGPRRRGGRQVASRGSRSPTCRVARWPRTSRQIALRPSPR